MPDPLSNSLKMLPASATTSGLARGPSVPPTMIMTDIAPVLNFSPEERAKNQYKVHVVLDREAKLETTFKSEIIYRFNKFLWQKKRGVALRLPQFLGEYMLVYDLEWTESERERFCLDRTLPRALGQIHPYERVRLIWIFDARKSAPELPEVDLDPKMPLWAYMKPAVFLFYMGSNVGVQIVPSEHLEIQPRPLHRAAFLLKPSYIEGTAADSRLLSWGEGWPDLLRDRVVQAHGGLADSDF